MQGTVDRKVALPMWQQLQVSSKCAWRIAYHGITPQMAQRIQDEDILSLYLVGPITLHEIREAVGRLKNPETPRKRTVTMLLPVYMNRCRGNHDVHDSREELVALGCKILQTVGFGRTKCYQVIPPEGSTFTKDTTSPFNKWWTFRDPDGVARLNVFQDDASGFEDRFLNVLDDKPKVQFQTAA